MFFLHKKHLTQRNLYTQIAYRSFYRPTFLHAETLPREQFLHNIFFSLRSLYAEKKISTAVFIDRTVLHRKFSAQKVLRTTFLHTGAFTHRCLYTDTNCTQKLVHTARVYTQPTFTQRGFASLLDHLLFVFPQSNDGEITIPHTILNHNCLEKKHREMDEHAHEPRKHVCISFPSTPPIFVCPYHIS